MLGGNNGTTTSTSAPYSLAGSFPHYKQIVMPPDQREKILAMHEASKANAGIYVAVVLAMYVILLTMLLCRYRRRFPLPSSDTYGGGCHHTTPLPTDMIRHTDTSSTSPLWKLRVLCYCSPTREDDEVNDDSPEEVGDVRMTTMAMTLIPRPPTSTPIPPTPTVSITLATVVEDDGCGSSKAVAV